jgi:hypothetical protein
MNKTIKIFGKTMSVAVVALTIMSVTGFAALVGYLSNTVTATATVESPVVLSLATLGSVDAVVVDSPYILHYSSGWVTTPNVLTIPSTTALDTSLIGLKAENKGNVEITGKNIVMTLSNSIADVSCSDIQSLEFLDTGTQFQINKGFQNLTAAGLCIDDGNSVRYNVPITSWMGNTIYEYPVKITWGAVAPATYTIDVVVAA